MSERIFVGDQNGNLEEKKIEQSKAEESFSAKELIELLKEKRETRENAREEEYVKNLLQRIEKGLKETGKFSERLTIHNNDIVLRKGEMISDKHLQTADFYKYMKEIQDAHPEFNIAFKRDTEGQWIEYTIVKK